MYIHCLENGQYHSCIATSIRWDENIWDSLVKSMKTLYLKPVTDQRTRKFLQIQTNITISKYFGWLWSHCLFCTQHRIYSRKYVQLKNGSFQFLKNICLITEQQNSVAALTSWSLKRTKMWMVLYSTVSEHNSKFLTKSIKWLQTDLHLKLPPPYSTILSSDADGACYEWNEPATEKEVQER